MVDSLSFSSIYVIIMLSEFKMMKWNQLRSKKKGTSAAAHFSPFAAASFAASFVSILSFHVMWDARLSWPSLSFFRRRFVLWWTCFDCTRLKSLSPRWTWFFFEQVLWLLLLQLVSKERRRSVSYYSSNYDFPFHDDFFYDFLQLYKIKKFNEHTPFPKVYILFSVK